MGGIGSGRKGYSMGTTDDRLMLDVRWMQRQGYLKEGSSFNVGWNRSGEEIASIGVQVEIYRLILNYQARREGGGWEQVEYPVVLERTHCNYGGRRVWFLCPVRGCGKRSAILYLGSSIFACRKCQRLTYESQLATWYERTMRKAVRIERRLGLRRTHWSDFPRGEKPRGMHWQTYHQLTGEHWGLVRAAWGRHEDALDGLVQRIRQSISKSRR